MAFRWDLSYREGGGVSSQWRCNTEKCQFDTEKCQFDAEKSQFRTEKSLNGAAARHSPRAGRLAGGGPRYITLARAHGADAAAVALE